jgi:large subunit ribosomal protein L23
MTKQEKKLNDISYKILVEPWITEEATKIAELNKYIFIVSSGAGKKQIKKAIEDLYNVQVISVNTINIPRKKRMRGRTVGWKSGYKKAIVGLKEGDKIEFFEGK